MSESKDTQTDKQSFRAFISYSHADKAVATWLHKTLEGFSIPAKLVGRDTPVGPVPKRLTPIFRDQAELAASGDLGFELKDALNNSLFLIVVCSPASAHSKWTNEEIRLFKAKHGSGRVLALIVEGEPNAPEQKQYLECFAPALKVEVNEDGTLTNIPSEPIAADLRKGSDTKRLVILRLVAGLTGLRLDDLVQRETTRRIQTLALVSVASVFAAVFAIGLAIYANTQRLEANEQREIAVRESATATTVSNFLIDIFESAQSVQTNPESITARSILDKGARRISQELKGQPTVQSRLSETIGKAYNNLGLFDQAIKLIDDVLENSGIEGPIVYSIKGEALLSKGDFNDALKVANYAEQLANTALFTKDKVNATQIRSEIAMMQARINYKLTNYEEALEAFNRALAETERLESPNKLDIATILQNRALLYSDMWELEKASADLSRAMELALDSVGDQDILVGQISLAQAQVNFFSENLNIASTQINTAISNMQRILDNDNPTLADAFSMKGQILHAKGDLLEARDALTQAVKTYTQAYNGRHYLSGIAEVYLGLISGDLEEYDAASKHFDEAKLHYDESYGQIHANHGDLLVNRATVLAKAGSFDLANKYCSEGILILNSTLGEDAGFTQQLQQVCNDIDKAP